MNRREFFDRHAADWDATRSADLEQRLRRVIAEAGVKSGDTVLDVGTGTGVLIPFIASAMGGQGRLLAFDMSHEMARQAAQRARGLPALVVQADAHALPCPDSVFDCVICNATLPHFEDRSQALRDITRALKPGGVLVVSHPIGRQAVNARHRAAGGPVGEDRVPPPEQMAEMLAAAGLTDAIVTDEPEFYLARARKRGRI
jgi:ubiquinone/menaquinone biosynthesis C-methylase UbiE